MAFIDDVTSRATALISDVVERFYAACDRIFGLLPEESQSRQNTGFLFLIILTLGIALADLVTPYAINLRPLFGVPLLLSAIYVGEAWTYALLILCTLLYVATFVLTTVIVPNVVTIAINVLPVTFFYLILTHFALTAASTVRTLSEQVRMLKREAARRH